jgi:3-deoxy-manno-octulosonate cytidylyltransferase (CMP-KDO synthetase)
MLEWVVRAIKDCDSISQVVVATDSTLIGGACDRMDAEWVLTGPSRTGTDRVSEVASKLSADLVVNVQGDEPLIEGSAISVLIRTAVQSSTEEITVFNACCRLSYNEFMSHHVVKAKISADGRISELFRDPMKIGMEYNSNIVRQLGLYAFHPSSLNEFGKMKTGALETRENVEILRFIENGFKVMSVMVEPWGPAVDRPSDVFSVIAVLNGKPRPPKGLNEL